LTQLVPQPSLSGVRGIAPTRRHTLRKATAVCEVMQLLTSPDSLGATERQRQDIGEERT
jgi:hypothetical protein